MRLYLTLTCHALMMMVFELFVTAIALTFHLAAILHLTVFELLAT